MTASTVSFPVADEQPGGTAVLATDSVDLGAGTAEVAYGKIVDGTPSGFYPMVVTSDGAVRAGSSRTYSNALANIATPAVAGYTAGQQMGELAEVASTLEQATYRLVGLRVLPGSAAPLPDDLAVVLVAYDPSDAPAWGTDGGTFAPNDVRAASALYLPVTFTQPLGPGSLTLGSVNLTGGELVNARPFDAGGTAGGGPAALGFFLVAAGTVAGDVDSAISVAGTLERVGPPIASLS